MTWQEAKELLTEGKAVCLEGNEEFYLTLDDNGVLWENTPFGGKYELDDIHEAAKGLTSWKIKNIGDEE